MSFGARSERNARKITSRIDAVDRVERDPAVQRGQHLREQRRQIQRHELVQEDEEREREQRGSASSPRRRSPAASSRLLRLSPSSSEALAENCSALTPSYIACPSVPTPRKIGILENRVLLRDRGKRRFFGDDLAVGLADRDAVAVRRPHHHAFHDGLAADKGGLLTAFQDRHQLRVGGQAEKAFYGQRVELS